MFANLGEMIDHLMVLPAEGTYFDIYFGDIQDEVGEEAWQRLRNAPLTFEEVQDLGQRLHYAGTAMVYRTSTDEVAASRQKTKDAILKVFCETATNAGVPIVPRQTWELTAQTREAIRYIVGMFPSLPE